MHPNEELLTRFYECFARRDAAGMARCYAPDARFSDGIFPNLSGERLRAMWEMVCEGGNDLEVTFGGIAAGDDDGHAWWEASYTFPPTGRHVRNRVNAAFGLRDGFIVAHHDSFSVWRWMSMAIGRKGVLLGWTPRARRQARQQAERGLAAFLRERKS